MLRTPNAEELPIDVSASSTFGVYPKISLAKTYNMYVSDGYLIPFAGWERVLDIFPEGEGRALFYSSRGDFLLAVVNSVVFRIDKNLVRIEIGTLETQSGEVYVDENLANQICLVDGVNAYIYNSSLPPNLLIQTAGALGSGNLVPSYVEYHNTHFLFGNTNMTGTDSRWYAYEPNAATTIQELTGVDTNFGLQTKPDFPIAIKRIPNQSANVLVFGKTVTEIHQNVPGGLQTYQRNNYINIDYGLASIETLASNDEHVTFLGFNEKNDPVLIDFSGQQARRISTDGIDHVLKNIKRPDRASADFYRQDGHLFYLITFYDDEDNLSLAYDFNEDKFYHLSDYQLNYFPARKIVNFDRKDYFISLKNASLYRLSTELTTQNENVPGLDPIEDPDCEHEIQRLRICSPIRSARTTRFIANQVTILIEQGNTNRLEQNCCFEYIITEDGLMVITEDGVPVIPEDSLDDDCLVRMYQPRVDLSFSIDGGISFSNTVSRKLNRLGHRRNILMWNRLGACNEMILKFRFWDAGRVVVGDGFLDARK